MRISGRFNTSNSRALLALSVLLGLAMPLLAEDWPQFRGVNSSGVSLSTTSLPVKFSTEENVLWQATLGESVASPIVVAGRVFTTAMTEEGKFAVYGFDASTGSMLWKQEFDTGKLPRITPPNSHASSTPCCDGERVYVHFSTLGLLALDYKDGKELWRHEIPNPAYLMDWGAANSPVVRNGIVYYLQDDDLNPFLLAIDAATGKTKWRAERPDMLAGYSMPVFCEAGGRTDLVIAGSGKLLGYDPDTGDVRWNCNTLLRTIMTSPVVRGDLIYIAVQSYGDEKRTLKFALLEWLDTNQDGILARDEVPKEFGDRFEKSDKNSDGKIEGAELDTAFQSPNNMVGGGSIIQAVRGGGNGDVTRTHVVWNLNNKSPSNLSSPLVVGEQLFVVKNGGLSSSFDAASGKTHWALSRIRNTGQYYSSPVAGDGKIFVTGENGFVTVIAQGSTLKSLSKNDLGEPSLSTPAIADGRLFFRTKNKLICVGE